MPMGRQISPKEWPDPARNGCMQMREKVFGDGHDLFIGKGRVGATKWENHGFENVCTPLKTENLFAPPRFKGWKPFAAWLKLQAPYEKKQTYCAPPFSIAIHFSAPPFFLEVKLLAVLYAPLPVINDRSLIVCLRTEYCQRPVWVIGKRAI